MLLTFKTEPRRRLILWRWLCDIMRVELKHQPALRGGGEGKGIVSVVESYRQDVGHSVCWFQPHRFPLHVDLPWLLQELLNAPEFCKGVDFPVCMSLAIDGQPFTATPAITYLIPILVCIWGVHCSVLSGCKIRFCMLVFPCFLVSSTRWVAERRFLF